MINNELIEKLLSLLQSKQYGAVKSLVQDMNEVDVAEAIEEIFEENEEPETLLRLFRLLPKETAAETFAYMHSDVQQKLVEMLSDTELGYILDDMYLDDYVDLVEEMPANVVKKLMQVSLRMVLTRKNLSVRSSNESYGQKPLHDWRIPPEHSGILKM